MKSRIQKLLSQMTLEEKIGQLQQGGPSLVSTFDVSFEELLNMMFDGRISQEEFGRRFAGRTGGTGCAVRFALGLKDQSGS